MDTIEYKNQFVDKLQKAVNKDGFKDEYKVEMPHNGTSWNIRVQDHNLENIFGIRTFYKEFTVWFSAPPMDVKITPEDGMLHARTQQLYNQLKGIHLEQCANEEERRAKAEQDKLREKQIENLAAMDKFFEHRK